MKHRTVKQEIINSSKVIIKIKQQLNKQTGELLKLNKEHRHGYSNEEADELTQLFIDITADFFTNPNVCKLSDLRFNQTIQGK